MSMKMKIISALAFTAACTFTSSQAVAAQAAMGPAGVPPHVHAMTGPVNVNMNAMPPAGVRSSRQMMQYDSLNNEIGYISDNNTGMGLLGNRIRVRGFINAGIFGQQYRGFLIYPPTAQNGRPKSHVYAVNYSGRLFFMADANCWVHAVLGFFYAGKKDPIGLSANAFTSSRYYGAGWLLYDNNASPIPGFDPDLGQGPIDGIAVDQAYIDVRNFACTPVAFRIGRAYAPFGVYDLNAATPTFAQILETTRADLVQLSYSGREGLYGAVYAFNGLNKRPKRTSDEEFAPEDRINPRSNGNDYIRNGGIEVGYHGRAGNFGGLGCVNYNFRGGYIINILDTNAFYRYIEHQGYTDRVGGWHLHGDVLFGPFGITANYVSADEDIELSDFARISHTQEARHAKPAAGNIYLTYHFMTCCRHSAIRAGYEWTHEAALFRGVDTTSSAPINVTQQSLALPKDRFAIEYSVVVMPNTEFSIGFNYNDSYSTTDGQSGDHSETEWARLTVAM